MEDEKNIIGIKGSTKEMDLPTLISSWKTIIIPGKILPPKK